MNTSDAMTPERNLSETAESRSYSYWFAFSYVPPASLVGREARMS